jgi:Family of unknown function (DUF5677)
LPSNRRRVRPLSKVSPKLLRESTDAMTALVEERLPLQFEEDNLWGPVAHGFLARGGTLLESLTLLVERGMEGEAQMLLRILFEHVTTFCWLAIDPEPHVEQWREWADSRRLKVHEDAKRFGIKVLTPAEVEQFKSAKPPLPLPQLAQKVDEHWSEVSTAFRPYEPDDPNILTFSGFYTAVYRKASNLVHADMVSVDRFMTMPLPRQAAVHASETHSESNDYPAFSVALMGFLMIVFEHHFGWPARNVIDGITNSLMYHDN